MNRLLIGISAFAAIAVLGAHAQSAAPAPAADPLPRVVEKAIDTYTTRLQQASEQLNATRQRILAEQQPLAQQERDLEVRATALEGEIVQLETLAAQKTERRQQLAREAAAVHKNLSYLTTLAQDTLKATTDSLLPGESGALGDKVTQLQQTLEDQSRTSELTAAMGTVDLLRQRTEQQLGGYATRGQALVGNDNRLVPGTFAFVGPEALFKTDTGVVGTVRTREGGVAVCYPVAEWTSSAANALFNGSAGSIAADPSGGKALRLREISGSIWQHIERGGVVAYAILAVGFLAVLIIIQKTIDAQRLALDSPEIVQRALSALRRGSKTDAEAAIEAMKGTTRQLFAAGLKHVGKPKHILEEHLFAHTLQLRLHFERRLPLLAVIATAAPLMGLLGTVMGMVKTFALITVFGTGNAGKLSGGISEVLVATELGLLVAIPALVAHGFLAHRIQKNLSLIDRYAIEFVTAAEEAKAGTYTDELATT